MAGADGLNVVMARGWPHLPWLRSASGPLQTAVFQWSSARALDSLGNGDRPDLVVCHGVLHYLSEKDAAAAAKRAGRSVLVVEPSRWVGGILGAGPTRLEAAARCGEAVLVGAVHAEPGRMVRHEQRHAADHFDVEGADRVDDRIARQTHEPGDQPDHQHRRRPDQDALPHRKAQEQFT